MSATIEPSEATGSSGGDGAPPREELTKGTLTAAAVGVAVAQIALSLPAVLNGLFQLDLSTSSTQLTWITDAFLVPVTLFELTFGVVGDLFGRKRLLAAGAALMVVGSLIAFFTPTTGSSDSRIVFLWIGQAVVGLGAAAIFPTSIAMLAAGTHTVKTRSRAISIWAAALTGAGFVSPVLSGLMSSIDHAGGPEASWRWAFLALGVLAALSVVTTLLGARNSFAREGRALDFPGQVTVALGLFALLFGVVQGAEDGWTSGPVIGAFVAAVVFLAAFVLVERRVETPLIRLDLFGNRIFVASAIVTVIGMFAYLGTAYATSIRLSAIQDYSPLKTSIGFVCLNVMGVVLFPVSARMIERHNPGWTLAGGMVLIGVGDLWISAIPSTNLSIAAVAVPLLIVGAGFKLAVTSITVVAVNSVPTDKAGMASGATSMLRDLGLTLGPAIVGAIALRHAVGDIAAKVAASPSLQAKLEAFNAAPGKAPAAQRPQLEAAVGAVNSGPLGANSVPSSVRLPNGQTMPLNPLKDAAFHALSTAYQIAYLTCGIAAFVAALVAALFLAGRSHDNHLATVAE